tara:strand:- start:3379 stop:3813 length:435 start_codon:yes stop_codon:yes gene_type:complete
MCGLKTYLIKKGKHYSGFRFIPFFRCREITIIFKFTDSCRYEYNNPQLTEQINKLFGFGALWHHRSSVRIGWRYSPKKDNIKLYTYKYIQGVRFEKHFDTVKIGQYNKLRIKAHRSYWLGKFLFPYFGGKEPAPHDIKILLDFM